MKLSLDAFKEQVATDDRRLMDEGEQRQKAQADAQRIKLECRPPELVNLVVVSRASQVFDTFPTSISLGSPNGHHRHLSLDFDGRHWRIGGDSCALQDLLIYGISATPPINPMLAALKIPHSPNAYRSLEQAVWPKAPPRQAVEFVFEGLRRLPRHCVLAAAGAGSALFSRLGVPLELMRDVAPMIVERFLTLGVDFAADPAPGVRSPLSNLAERNDFPMLQEALNTVRPDDQRVIAAAHRAVGSVQYSAARLFLDAGVDPRAVDDQGASLLHALAIGYHHDHHRMSEALAIVELFEQVDRDAVDNNGRTASDYATSSPQELRDALSVKPLDLKP